MNKTEDERTELIYVDAGDPNVGALRAAYIRTMDELGFYIEGCASSYNDRRAIWPGKSRDQRKNAEDAFPWKGAADTEARVIDERIRAYVAMFMAALVKANIRAYPVEANDLARARLVSNILKWMVSSYIKDFARQMELGANYLLEKGIVVTYVGWQKTDQTYKQKLTLAQLQGMPQLARMVLEGQDDMELAALLQTQWPSLSDKRAKKILSDLRKKGEAEFPIVRRSEDYPLVRTLAPDGDWFFPAYTIDPQRAPYGFWRTYMTAQELRNKVSTDGWDEEWVEYVIENCRSGRTQPLVADRSLNVPTSSFVYNSDELYEIVYGYRRMVDEEDNSVGIYCTVFQPNLVSDRRSGEVPDYAKHDLLNGYDCFPVVVTRLSEDSKRLYEVESFSDLLRGIQWTVKVERDSRIDRNSMATLPPLLHLAGNPPKDYRPGGFVPYRRQGEIQFGPVPQFNAGSVEMEKTQEIQADKLVGLGAPEVDPWSSSKQQFLVGKFLYHIQEVLRMAYKCYQRFGPDEVWFQVTGVPEPQRFDKGNPDEDYNIIVSFDVLNHDPETVEKRLNSFASLLRFDHNGRINIDAWLSVAAGSIDPVMADMFLQPADQAQQQVVKNVTEDLKSIYSGIAVGARPNGAQIAMQVIQQWASQPDISARIQQDEAFKGRVETYVKQNMFQLQQAQNALTGKIGTPPAQMGQMQTQGLNAP